jgi:ABC-2 type transport system permease protein
MNRVFTKAWPILLRPKIMGLTNRWGHSEKRSLLKPLLLAFLAVGFWVLTFWVFQRVLLYFRSVDLFGDLLASKLLAMMLLTFFSILLFSNMISSLSTFFLAEDLHLVLSCPVSFNRLYYARLTETAIHSSWMVLLFGLPVFFAYGWVYHSSLEYYLVLIGTLIPFLIIPAALGTLFSMVLVNIFPARRTKEILFLLSVILVIGLYFLLRFLQPERLVDPKSFAGLVEYFTALNTPSWPFLPSFWATESLLPFYQGDRANSGFFLGLLWSTAGAMGVLGNWASGGLFFNGWNKSQEARRARLTQSPLINRFMRQISRPLDPRLKALAIKDFKCFFRDTTQWAQLFLLSALVVVYLYNFSVLPLDKSPMPTFFLQNLISFLNMGLAGFVLSAVAGRFVFPAVSLEGSSFWIIRSAPVSLRSFLRSKFLMSLFPLLILAEVLIFLSNYFLQVSPFMMILSGVTIFFMAFGIVSLGIGVGAMYPRFRVENAAQIASGFGGFFFMILSMLFIGGVVILEAWPVYTIFMGEFNQRALSSLEWTGIVLSFAGVAVLMGVAVIIPMRLGIRRIAEMDL